jgi:hypothetical protein
MKLFHAIRTRLSLLFARRSAERRMSQEIGFHVEMETERLMREGFDPAEARRQALIAFGGVEQYKEELRDGRGLGWLAGLSLVLVAAVMVSVGLVAAIGPARQALRIEPTEALKGE